MSLTPSLHPEVIFSPGQSFQLSFPFSLRTRRAIWLTVSLFLAGSAVECLRPLIRNRAQITKVRDIDEETLNALSSLLQPVVDNRTSTMDDVVALFLPDASREDRRIMETFILGLSFLVSNEDPSSINEVKKPNFVATTAGLWPSDAKEVYMLRLRRFYLFLYLLALVDYRSAFVSFVHERERTRKTYTEIVNDGTLRGRYSEFVVALEELERQYDTARVSTRVRR